MPQPSRMLWTRKKCTICGKSFNYPYKVRRTICPECAIYHNREVLRIMYQQLKRKGII